ncbi:uncharacterized protein BDR25DRAFT_381466 [Lindgomyces ingoldianus]|uniref:Uncharacterized protein n=1 Tax=Lindgomyces ingoldianus TaxID=673940 RepID=A0ACB6QDX8_9PLEO|nr:uncharacterized protein BDR25DRAFT_381466 [Lindgomyces ingoldianus]KAF2464346.1 hypothetical protein BDR25DRAFT_381466 [Lindgomyces ingoldianus]
MAPKLIYQDRTSEDHEADDEEALIGSKQANRQRQFLRRSCWGKVRANWWIVDSSLLLVIIFLLVEPRMRNPSPRLDTTGDVTGFAPKFSQKIVSFEPDLSFVPQNTSSFWDKSVRDKWLSIVPRGLGYVRVNEPSRFKNLPTPLHDFANMTVFTTSMPHQLHCLYNILEVYSAITSGNPHAVPTEMTFHLQHCFEYLRLSIMCCGDVALEGAQTTFPEGFPGSDGWDAKHVCRDYSEIYEYLEEKRANDRVWIGGADDIH